MVDHNQEMGGGGDLGCVEVCADHDIPGIGTRHQGVSNNCCGLVIPCGLPERAFLPKIRVNVEHVSPPSVRLHVHPPFCA